MRILMIVPPERRDFYNYFESELHNDYLLLWHESKKQFLKTGIKTSPLFKEVFFWNQFKTPQDLLKKIKPDRIVFFEIIDQLQIALIVRAKKKNIPTFYLEHGAAASKETSEARANDKEFLREKKIPYIFWRIRHSLLQVLRTKVFYYSNLFVFNKLSHLFLYWKVPFLMLRYTPNKALTKCFFHERVPKYSIVFNKVNFRQYETYTGIDESEALLTGVPFFDIYHQSQESNEGHIIYIEQPYLEQNLMDWTPDHHYFIAETLSRFANFHKRKFYVKLHPLSDIRLWQHVMQEDSYLKVMQWGDFTSLYLSSSLIFGFSSSLITGLICAKKNVVNIGWHPKPQIFGVDFSKTGLCHLSLSPKDLELKFSYFESNNLCVKNELKYQAFIREFNYPFDGKATDRVIEAIVGS